MRGRENSWKLARALLLSLLVHAGLAAVAGGVLSSEQPEKPAVMEVALEIIPPLPPAAKAGIAGEPGPGELPAESEPAPEPAAELAPKPEPEPIVAPTPEPEPEPEPEPMVEPVAAPEPEVVVTPPPDPAPPVQLEPSPEPPAPQPPTAETAPPSTPEIARGTTPDHGPGKPDDGMPGSEPETGPAGGGPFGRSGPDALAAYQREVRRRIEQAKRYPREARLAGRRGEGVSKVRFEIAADGSIGRVDVSQSSGMDALDRAAEAAVTDAAPFPALPTELGRERITVVVPIQFRLR